MIANLHIVTELSKNMNSVKVDSLGLYTTVGAVNGQHVGVVQFKLTFHVPGDTLFDLTSSIVDSESGAWNDPHADQVRINSGISHDPHGSGANWYSSEISGYRNFAGKADEDVKLLFVASERSIRDIGTYRLDTLGVATFHIHLNM